MQIQVEEVGHQMKEMTTSFEADLDQERWKLAEAEREHRVVLKQMEGYIEQREERWRMMECEEGHQVLIKQMEDRIAKQERAVNHWKESFSQLVALANGAIENIPRMVSDAEAMTHFCNPPEEIKLFINYCKWTRANSRIMESWEESQESIKADVSQLKDQVGQILAALESLKTTGESSSTLDSSLMLKSRPPELWLFSLHLHNSHSNQLDAETQMKRTDSSWGSHDSQTGKAGDLKLLFSPKRASQRRDLPRPPITPRAAAAASNPATVPPPSTSPGVGGNLKHHRNRYRRRVAAFSLSRLRAALPILASAANLSATGTVSSRGAVSLGGRHRWALLFSFIYFLFLCLGCWECWMMKTEEESEAWWRQDDDGKSGRVVGLKRQVLEMKIDDVGRMGWVSRGIEITDGWEDDDACWPGYKVLGMKNEEERDEDDGMLEIHVGRGHAVLEV
ncbi:hypothetical protein LR48_Vigan11g099600 [Vigna angularis]|uniref:Uncharacterized protein n=1 Tax=Phaseolus angularis TaxID=3914 RepID=A0A0L9VSQ6_PHAAN|nr:hypothetical protein LR48_Vigan11g099600 [Vigna angularis]